ncbi:MAG: uroporphyrinogen-III C-methyltransferase, partial [Treponema sp.]|nr:uroporphyrinogen-III C-methyltransferase [Treponema sp.]
MNITGIGKIILVGAGPGSAGLLTLRGKQALEEADVVLYDRLVGGEILGMIPESAAQVDVGKSCGKHNVPQHEINAMLLRFAGEGKQVVRLKGGDPYLFGRGAEELETVLAGNDKIPFEVVPGVTSAIAVPAFAGIPITHREISSSVHIITAHRKNGKPPEIDYQSLVKLGGTLVFMMGLSTIDAITSGLLAAGLDAATPAALVENGTRGNQRNIISTAAEVSARSKMERFSPPCILVVGDVCSLSEKLDWTRHLPLKGACVIVTRPKAHKTHITHKKHGDLSEKLREFGANVIDFPCIRTVPLPISDSVSRGFADYGWIVFTSPVGAELFFENLKAGDMDIRLLHRVKFAAVGETTAGAIKRHAVRVDYMPKVYNARELADGLPFCGDNPRTLLFRARNGAPRLASTLRERGFLVEDIPAYETIFEKNAAENVREMIS